MSSIKVVDINEETAKGSLNSNSVGVETKLEPIEEAKEEVVNEPVNEHEVSCSIHEVMLPSGSIREPIEEAKPEVVNEVAEEVCKEIKKPEKALDKIITCPKCNKSMKLKSYRYKHEKQCAGTLEQKAVKPFSKPRAKPKAQPKLENTIETKASPPIKLTQEVSNQVLKPEPQLSPYEVARQSYIHMREEMRQKKIEKINNFKAKMF